MANYRKLVVLSLLSLGRLAEAAPPPILQLPMDADAARHAQAEWAAHLQMPVELVNSVGMKLILVPPGRFTMGPNGCTYRVSLSKPFYIGVTEVTLGEYRRFRAGHKIDGAEAQFNADDRPAARQMLRSCAQALPAFERAHPDLVERICIAALKVGGGDLDELRAATRLARLDWRDLLVRADFAEDVTAHLRWRPGGSP